MNDDLNPGRPAARPVNGGDSADTKNFAAPPRGPVDAIRTCLVKFFDFRGRASRSEFWWFFAVAVVLREWLAKDGNIGYFLFKMNVPGPFLAAAGQAVFYFIMLPLWAVAVRRLHDVNHRGWWVLPDVALNVAHTAAGIYVFYFFAGNFPFPGTGKLFDRVLAYIAPASGIAAWVYVWTITLFERLTEGGQIVLLCFCLFKSKPQQNRFDRRAESFGFSFNRQPAKVCGKHRAEQEK